METGRPTTYADSGMVASPHYFASQVGVDILRNGGNAVDAAIAVNAVLTVVLPHQCHLGGDLFAMVWDPQDGDLQGLNASGPSAAGASLKQVMGAGHTSMPQRGALTVTVPGTVAGWAALLDRYGTRDLAELLEPAAGFAEDGFPISARLATAIDVNRDLIQQDPVASSIFLNDSVRAPGDRLRQLAYAATLRKVAKEGTAGFYEGSVAEDIVATLQAGGSAMQLSDLADFQPEWVTPLRVPYGDVELAELPPNTQGPAALLLALIADGWPVADLGPDSVDLIHLDAEAVRRVLTERDRYIGDPRMVEVPLERFVDPSAGAAHRQAIDPEYAAPAQAVPGDGDTVYFCVVDRDGLAVSMIQSVYLNFGSGLVTSESGVLLHCRGNGFSFDPNHPNALAGGVRPRHTLIPAMLLRDGKPAVVFGAMGADGQAQTQLQLLHCLVDFGFEPQRAIEQPRWYVTADETGWGTLRVESSFDPATIEELRRRGHRIVVGDHWDQKMGHAQAIVIDRERGILSGGADPRGDGLALGI